jgi:hypothetical protein
MQLTNRERFLRLYDGEPVDRAPFFGVMADANWDSAIARWKTEGLDPAADSRMAYEMMGFDTRFERALGYRLPVNTFVWPEYEREVIDEDEDRVLARGPWGGLEQTQKGSGFIPLVSSPAVQDRASWTEIKARLDPSTPGRLPENWSEVCREARESGDPIYAGDLPLGFFGSSRELLGPERQAVLFYDDPELMHDILGTLCDLWIDLFRRVQRDVPLDYFYIWEDMCYKKGPVVSVAIFREFFLPHYLRFISALREGGCRHFLVDSDGDVRMLVPSWLESGVTIIFPWETQFGLDISEIRRCYPTMGMMGGINKSSLSRGRTAVDTELEKVPYMLESGRYVPGLDHGVTHEVSWDTYRYFCDRLRALIAAHPPAPFTPD